MSSKNFKTKLLDLQSNMLNFAYLLTSNRDDAYDLLQDTTLKALDNEDKYVDNTNFKGWVFTIMRNIFINNYRKVVRPPWLTARMTSTILTYLRSRVWPHRRAQSRQTRSQPQSTHFPTTIVYLSPCMCRGTNTTRSPRK